MFTKFREQAPLLNKIIAYIPYPFKRAITCTFCFGYWLALAASLVFDPLGAWNPTFMTPALATAWPVLKVLGGWYAIGLLATFWRLTYFIMWKKMLVMNQLAGEPHAH